MNISKEQIIAIFTTIVLFFLGYVIIQDNSKYLEESVDKLSKEIINSQSLALEKSVAQSTASAVILKNHMHTVNGDMSDFEEYASELYKLLGGITNLQLAPNGVVSKIYPLKGHEKAIGHDIFNADDRKKEAFLAKKSKKLTIAGPFNLVQGGVAIVARSPVYLDDDSNKNEHHVHSHAKKFWGFSSALVLLDDLLKTTELNTLKDKKYLFRLWRYHPDTNEIDVFAGEKELPQKNLFTKKIKIPNSQWYLDIEYVGSYISTSLEYIFYSINFLVSLMLGYLMYVILHRPKELREEVSLKTDELNIKNSELNYEKSELKKLTNAVTYNNNAIFIVNNNGIIEYINPAFEQMTGYDLNDIKNLDLDLFKKEINRAIENKININVKATYKTKSDVEFIAMVTISIVYDKTNNTRSYVGVCEDITQKIKDSELLREKEILLLQQSKMAAMGEMIGNIAHQWRQPLSVITVSATGLKIQHEMGILTDEILLELLDGITDSSDYLSNTINDFRNFFKPDKSKTLCTSTVLMDKMISILSPQFKKYNIEIIKNIEPVEFEAFHNELLQVIINVINNAKDQLMNLKIDKKLIFVDMYKKNNDVFIKIKDNGGGIPTDLMTKIFEPYFTTKEQSLGTGIGLYMGQEIIVKHMNGRFFAKNEEFTYNNNKYTGAEFSIILKQH